MAFNDSFQHGHKVAGFAAAAKSHKTPIHLRVHQQRLAEGTMKSSTASQIKDTGVKATAGVPVKPLPTLGKKMPPLKKKPMAKGGAFYGDPPRD